MRLIGSSRFYNIKIIADRENMVQAEWPDNLTDRKYKKKTKNKTKNKKTNKTKATTLTLHLTVY